MKYTVIWSPEAESDLTRLWTDSASRTSITMAANLLDQALASGADNLGESRSGGRRIAFCAPLVIDFEIDEGDRKAYVLAVRECKTPEAGQ